MLIESLFADVLKKSSNSLANLLLEKIPSYMILLMFCSESTCYTCRSVFLINLSSFQRKPHFSEKELLF